MTTNDPPQVCGCIRCFDARTSIGPVNLATELMASGQLLKLGFRYACEICGNKRCPHHSNHELACTGSNEPGQSGSVFTPWHGAAEQE